MAFSDGYIFGFAGAVCAVCSLLVAGAATSLKDMQDLNKQRDLQGNILGALGLTDEENPPIGEEIDKLWKERVKIVYIKPDGSQLAAGDTSVDQDNDGDVDLDDVDLARTKVKGSDTKPAVLSVYQRLDKGKPVSSAIPVFGAGLWGPVSGYIAIDAKGETVEGVTFAAPKETPGLGAEIMADAFMDQWVGKKLVDGGKSAPIRVAKGKAKDLYPNDLSHWVDGVSGATITCRGVTGMMETGVAHYDSYLTRLRKGG